MNVLERRDYLTRIARTKERMAAAGIEVLLLALLQRRLRNDPVQTNLLEGPL